MRSKAFKRHHRIGLPLAMLAVMALAHGCAEQPTMILIIGAGKPLSSCSAPSAPSEFLTSGVIDVSFATGYIMTPFVQNVTTSSENVGAQGKQSNQNAAVWEGLSIEGNRVILTRAQVEFSFLTELPASVMDVFRSFDLPIGGTVLDPAGGGMMLPVTTMNSFHVETLRSVVQPGQQALMMVSLRFFGVTTSDSKVESNLFKFPITICNGCLYDQVCTDSRTTAACIPPGQDEIYCVNADLPPEEEPAREDF